ncbi:DUF1415 domain-containing protein [Noviherbaspirillum sp.]|uniref:DUF1415 domain-containing protein n=1 Tax=Noviherbaspirillum sp. TaxID=1926288 RepID=UPI002B48C347|nr:DUF1415 domain-containing protein [Noviherbaspirillum sp.]HJV79225.1 DUF1415 domain-containing protein [Noviherbaspirillum sp.]
MTIHTDETARYVTEATRQWLEKAVIGLNLCPFAKSVHIKKQIRYAVSRATNEGELHLDLIAELQALQDADPDSIDTSLLIHPWALTDFLSYNNFLDLADATVAGLGLAGKIQIASFHPQYQFADAEPDDIGNFTNRSPYPMLHLLREESIDRAVAAFPDAEEIFGRNIETIRRLGYEGWKQLNIATGSLPTVQESGEKRKN